MDRIPFPFFQLPEIPRRLHEEVMFGGRTRDSDLHRYFQLDDDSGDDKEKYGDGDTDDTDKSLASYYCDICEKEINGSHFSCDWCLDGEFDLCLDCFNQGIRCHDNAHRLRKYTFEDGEVVEVVLWRDKDFITTIPEFFTLDLNDLHGPGSPTLKEALCKCEDCQGWFAEVCSGDDNSQFCIRKTTNFGDFECYRLRNIDWPPNNENIHISRDSTATRLPALSSRGRSATWPPASRKKPVNKPTKQLTNQPIGREDWTMIICITRTPRIRGHGNCSLCFLFPHAKNREDREHTERIIYTVRSFSSDDPSAADFSAHPGGIVEIVNSAETWERAHEYLSECHEQHDTCRQRDIDSQNSEFYPTRVIDVGIEGACSLRLISATTLQENSIYAGYLTLSYTWGEPQLQETTISNIDDRTNKGFRLDQQPQTIQDAVKVTRALGFRYLWIDSLCIVQDDEVDKAKDISRMDQVYQHSALLISAARAGSASEGFLDDADIEMIDENELLEQIPIRYRCGDTQGHIVLEQWPSGRHQPPGYTSPTEIIHTRAWTMQEHLLSKRILAFGSTGMRWSCLGGEWFGSHSHSVFTNDAERLDSNSWMACRLKTPTMTPPWGEEPVDEEFLRILSMEWKFMQALGSEAGHAVSAEEEWDRLRCAFSLRNITKAEDKLPAFSAVAKQFFVRFGNEGNGSLHPSYVAGHWMSQLPADLLWSSKHGQQRYFGEVYSGEVEPSHESIPTWSWISSTNVRWAREMVLSEKADHEYGQEETAHLLDVDVRAAMHGGTYGRIESARLLIYANFFPVILSLEAREEWDVVAIPADLHLFSTQFSRDALSIECELDADYRCKMMVSLRELYRQKTEKNQSEVRAAMDVIEKEWSESEYCVMEIERQRRSNMRWDFSKGLVVRRLARDEREDREVFARVGTFKMGCEFQADGKDLEHVHSVGQPPESGPFAICQTSEIWLV